MTHALEAIEIKCPKCKQTEIIYLPNEAMPKCPEGKIQMIIQEVLRGGKTY